MKFDVEGEENFIIPDLISKKVLNRFDVLYSEFHIHKKNNPLYYKSKEIFLNYLNYTKSNGIETYEEGKISSSQISSYLNIYYELITCKGKKYK